MSAYTDCMKPYMAGGGPDRKLRFCVGAKLCSGKATDEETAKQICQSQPAKVSSGTAGGKAPAGSCTTSMATLAVCAIRKINWDVITQETFEEHLTRALQECSCRPKRKVAKTAPAPTVRTFPDPSKPHWSKS